MRRAGFTLIELMIVVAILGIFASIAVPLYSTSVLKSRRAEGYTVLDGIGTSEVAYNASQNVWIEAESNPGTSLGKAPRPWDPSLDGWSELGYLPDGEVRCNYLVSTFDDGEWARGDVYCDVDDDNRSYILRYYLPSTSQNQSYHGWREVNAARY